MSRGRFIAFEGGEGVGKSTQARLLADALRKRGLEVLLTREPGGTEGGEAIRRLLLDPAGPGWEPEAEALLFAAARSDHVEQVIRPAVERGSIVLCDRFIDSSRVYQGVTGGLDADFMKALEAVAINGMMPDMTLIFDIDPVEGLKRATARRGAGDAADRFEKETLAIHRRRREAFLAIAAAEPERCVVIDASADPDTVENVVTAAVFAALEERMPAQRIETAPA